MQGTSKVNISLRGKQSALSISKGQGPSSKRRWPSTDASTHTSQAFGIWRQVERTKRGGAISLDGSNLDIASVLAAARYICDAYIMKTEVLTHAMNSSVAMLEDYLSKGYCVYGVNTGFSGSADTRTKDLVSLQSALLQLTEAGILTDDDINAGHEGGAHSMPTTWVRATMLIRCNNVLRGHSGVRLDLVEAILHMLRKGMTPIVPLRGSISASGDLVPLSCIVGMLEGNPDIHVHVTNSDAPFVVAADEALQGAGLQPFILGPKEGLGMINGTAVSAAVGCLAVHESDKLALLAQGLVAMTCEALLGKAENYHPFIAAVCPHPGQTECAGNVLHFLQGPSLVESLEGTDKFKLGPFPDRFALRGTPQWLGPQLEDLSSVLSQVTTELNSTSDNPVIDIESGEVYSGANFIASSIANGIEKSRLSLQMVGKLLFSLTSELINPTLNRGLPLNLAADDPILSFTMKGIDISMAAYMSELGYLATPVTSQVQSAEMHNQSINSLALILGWFTMQTADITAHMCVAHLFTVCQALDLRALHITFLRALSVNIWSITEPFLLGIEVQDQESFHENFCKAVANSWNASASFDLDGRCEILSQASLPVLIDHLVKHKMVIAADTIQVLQQCLKELAHSTFTVARDEFFNQPITKSFLGCASKKLYSFVRDELGVPFHQGLVEHPGPKRGETVNGRRMRTIGSWVTRIYKAISNDRIWHPLAEAMLA
ncbi:L-Aspartase-like protein [Dactylonectria macrodidyma]|uniref:L-Aspartase-like protein n=1 Tax=Dactylonectria macrodidyma TaxID=307937 RepID=A0A9P9IJM2_9HYPO|nr:L-Aspartase-like protein [Dactylonectria macrodidyma]